MTIVIFNFSEEDQLFKVMYRLASSERYFYHQLSLIQEHLMTPLMKTGETILLSTE